MVQPADARTTLERQATELPHAISAYRDHRHFDEVMGEAAERIARWRGLRLQWLALTVAGVVLIVLTAVKIVEFNVLPRGVTVINGWWLLGAWAVALMWTWLYYIEVDRLTRRIIERRLCLRCGRSLIDEPLDERGAGVCAWCLHVFHIGEYTPPTDAIEAMRRARQRTMELRRPPVYSPPPARFPPRRPMLPRDAPVLGLYENRQHFERTINRAASRLVLHRSGNAPFLISAVAGTFPLLFAFVWIYLFNWTLVALALALAMAVALVGLSVITWRNVMAAHILDHHLCLSCGYPLKGIRVNEHGCGRCPECGRAFHAREFIAPGTDVFNKNWRETRRTLFATLEGANDQYESRRRKLAIPMRPSSPFRCHICGDDLSTAPIDAHNEGVCGECGTPFRRTGR